MIKCIFNLKYYISYVISKPNFRLNKENERKEKIIASLTTYNKRIKTVFLVIEALFKQTVKPDKIVLWLDKNEFTNDTIPNTLKKQIKQGLEIKFYSNIKSYKKLIPSLLEFPNDIIITFDDDILYPQNCIENLYKAYLKDGANVYCNYSFEFLNCDFHPTTNLKKLTYKFNYVGTGAGTLFPPKILPTDIFNEAVFMKYAPLHDDIFVSVLLLKNNIKLINVNKNPNLYIKLMQKLMILNTQNIGLYKQNYFENKTKVQLLNLLEYYNLQGA